MKKKKIKVPLNQNSEKENKINNGERKYNKSKKSQKATKRNKQGKIKEEKRLLN